MKTWRKEMMASPEAMEPYLEKRESTTIKMVNIAAHPEVPNEEAVVELSEHWRTDMGTGI
jgi:hypothetical protein